MRYIILGTGNIAQTYINALENMPASECVGFISRGQATANKPVWQRLEDVNIDFDAVIAATPNALHHEGIIAAAAMGKHVITEKPLAISREYALQAITACEKAGTTLAVAFQRRTAEDNRSVKALLDNKAFGKIYAADLSAKFYRPQSYYDSADYRGGWSVDGGGVFMQQACHNLDIYTWFFGRATKVVSMLKNYDHDIEAEDHGVAIVQFSSGMMGTIAASTAAKPGFAARLEVHTEKGGFTLTDDKITQWDIEGVANPAVESHYAHDGATSAVVADTSAHEAIIADFEHCIAHGGTPIADAHSTLMTTELIEQIYANNLNAS